MTQDEFISKWMPKSSYKLSENISAARLYWELIYEDVCGWELYDMAEDLCAIYPDNLIISNSAVVHARSYLESSR